VPSRSGRSRLDVAKSPQRQPAREPEAPAILPPSTSPPLHRRVDNRKKSARAQELADASPLHDQFALPRLPESPHLPAGPRLRVASPDVNQPIPLPVLGQRAPDRAALDDPTVDVSLALALAISPPLRLVPAPFLRLALPN